MKKIKDLFRRAYDRLFRRKAKDGQLTAEFYAEAFTSKQGGLTREQVITAFKQLMAEAYPAGEGFLSNLSPIPNYANSFILDGGFATNSFLSARGIQTDMMPYEKFKELIDEHPEWKSQYISVIVSSGSGQNV